MAARKSRASSCKFDRVVAQSPLAIGRAPAHQSFDVLFGQRLKLKDAAAADQGTVDREKRIGGGRSDQHDNAVFHVRQQGVLLRLVEPMNLVDEKQCPRALGGEHIAGFVENRADSFTPLVTALSCRKRQLVSWASRWASTVLPVPGGPKKRTAVSRSA